MSGEPLVIEGRSYGAGPSLGKLLHFCAPFLGLGLGIALSLALTTGGEAIPWLPAWDAPKLSIECGPGIGPSASTSTLR